MKRRDFLKGAAIAGAASTTLAAPAVAQSTIQMKLAGAFPKGLPGVGTTAERLARRIEALSDGKIEVKYYGGGELVPPFEVFNAVSSGAAEIGHGAPYFQVGTVRSSMYFTTFPYGLDATEMAAWIHYGGGQALWDEAYAPFGVKPFYAGNSGTQAGGWFKKPIEKLDDLIGLKMRIAGLGGDVMRKIGVTTVLMPVSEIYTGLQTGAIDAAEFVGPWNDVALGFYKVAPYYYMPAFHEPGPTLEMIVNSEVYENLSPFLKTVFDNAASAEAEQVIAEYRYHNTMVLKDLVAKGAKVSAFSDDVVAALGKASKEVIADFPNGDPMSEKIHTAYFDYVKDCVAYTSAMDGRMYNERQAVWNL